MNTGNGMHNSSRLTQARRLLARLHADECGAEGLEKLLIIAAIVIPLLGVLIFFRNTITEWVNDKWEDIQGDADDMQIEP